MNDGLKDKHRKAIFDILTANPRVERVVLFGSRAMGTFTTTSDVDLALFGDELTLTDQARLAAAIDKLPMAQQVDLLIYKSIDNDKLKQHIKKHGKEWFRRGWVINFEFTTLGEYARVQGGYAYKSADFLDSGTYSVLKIKNVRFGHVDYSESAFIDKKLAEETLDWATNEGDILISLTGSGPNAPQSLVGRVARVWRGEPRAWINQRVGRLKLKSKGAIHTDFLFYLLSSPRSQDYLVSNSSGSANQANISGKIVESLPCPKVDYGQSAIIAKVLRELDEKILVNRQINQTLEEIAQAIFKSWFVDFEPVKAKIKAKANGQNPERAAMCAISGKTDDQLDNLPPDQLNQLRNTAALFPDELTDSELGLIPKGWEVGCMKDCCLRVESGGTPKRGESNYWDGNIRWLSSGEVRDVIILDTKEKITEEGLRKSSAKLWPYGSTVVAMYGATAGQVCLLAKEMAANQACCALIPRKNCQNYMFLTARRSIEELSGKASGSAQQNLNKSLVSDHRVLLPDEQTMKAFEQITGPFLKGWIRNIKQNNVLAQLRDTLLPKLLSGEISVGPTPQATIEEAV